MSDDKKITVPRAAATAEEGQPYVSITVIIMVRSVIRNKQVLIYYLN